MCVCPLHIKQNAVYKDGMIHPYWNEVPCGQCSECKNSLKMEWQTRISFELQSLYRRGGVAVMLMFSYKPSRIPYYDDGDFHIRCFSRKDIKTFLNRLKIRVYRRWGKNCYRYFFCSEYGKKTQRPHYHAIFMLSHGIDYVEFIELCRELWCENGFLFPKYSKERGCYIDNKKRRYEPRLRSLSFGAKYVAKYITKDMSYYGLPELAKYLENKNNKWKMRDYLPKHYQSKGLGFCIVDYINVNDDRAFRDALDNGIYNPVFGKLTPLPRYFLDKMMYRYVRSDRTGHPRQSFRTGKYLYDRVLSDFGRSYQRQIFDNHIRKYSLKMSTVFQWIQQNDPEKLRSILPILVKNHVEISNPQTYGPFALFHEVYKDMTDSCVLEILYKYDGDFDGFTEEAFNIWLHRRDMDLMRSYRYSSLHVDLTPDFTVTYPLFTEFYQVDRVFAECSSQLSVYRLSEYNRRQERYNALREKFTSRFPTDLV